MAIKKFRFRPEGVNDYSDILHPETSADVVLLKDTAGNFSSNNVEGALSELFTSVSDGKNDIAAAIADMGQSASGSNTFAQLAAKIRDISDDANASVSNVLSGRTFYQGGAKRTGTMPNRGAVVITPSTNNQTIQAGYHNGSGYVKGDSNLTAANIKKGVSIFGVTGTLVLASVKSVQRGVTTIGEYKTSVDVPISPIVASNSVILIQTHPRSGGIPGAHIHAGQIINNNTIRVLRGDDSIYTTSVYWTVIEFSNVKSKQTGVATPGTHSSSVSVGIQAVDLSKSLIFTSHTSSLSTSTDSFLLHGTTRSEFVSSTEIKFHRYSLTSSTTQKIYWQVIEFD